MNWRSDSWKWRSSVAGKDGKGMHSIGIFDSGVGGLTVLKALRIALPHENFVYLGDTARLPYGTKSPATIRRYLHQNVSFLMRFQVKAIVVACNSASTVVDDPRWQDIPLYDVIRPGARAACAASVNRRVGILGTEATVKSGAYVAAIRQLDAEVATYQQACPLLVPLVEEGWENDPITEEILHRYLRAFVETGVDTLVLGCTHYPVLKPAIRRVVGPDVALIDSAEVLARRLHGDIDAGLIAAAENHGGMTIWATDLADSFTRVGQRIMQPFDTQHWHLADIQALPS